VAGRVRASVTTCGSGASPGPGAASARCGKLGRAARTVAAGNAPSHRRESPTTFTSAVYGSTIGLGADPTVKPASLLADDPKSTEATGTDVITGTGTDATIQMVVSDLGGQAFGALLKGHPAAATPNMPSGCDGGDPVDPARVRSETADVQCERQVRARYFRVVRVAVRSAHPRIALRFRVSDTIPPLGWVGTGGGIAGDRGRGVHPYAGGS